MTFVCFYYNLTYIHVVRKPILNCPFSYSTHATQVTHISDSDRFSSMGGNLGLRWTNLAIWVSSEPRRLIERGMLTEMVWCHSTGEPHI